MPRLTRKQRERAAHRREILEAAEAIFAQKGYSAATVQEVADRAEFSVGYLYNLFKSKEDLFAQLVDMRTSEHLEDLKRRVREAADVLAKVQAVIRGELEFFETHQQFFLIFARMVSAGKFEGPFLLSQKIRSRYEAFTAQMARVFSEGMRKGLFIEADPRLMVRLLLGLTHSVIAHWMLAGGRGMKAPAPEIVEQVFLRGILVNGKQ